VARTALTVYQIARAGLEVTYVAADDSDMNSFANDGKTFLHVKNTQTDASVSVTIAIAQEVDGQSVTSRVVGIGAETEEFIGPFDPGVYNQSTGVVNVDFDTSASVSVAAIRV